MRQESITLKVPHGPKQSSNMLRAGIFVLFVLVLWFNPYQKSQANIWLGLVVLILSLQPLDAWLRSARERTVPVFELHLLFYAICFGFAAFTTVPSDVTWIRVNEKEYSIGLIATILGLLSLRFGYKLASLTRGRLFKWITPQIPVGQDDLAVLVVYPAALFLELIARHFHLDFTINVLSALRLFALAWSLCAAWSGRLRRTMALLVTLVFLPIDFALFSGISGGYLVGLLTYGELTGVIYALTRGRTPILLALAVAASFFLLQPVKNTYRETVWNPNIEQSSHDGASEFFSEAFSKLHYEGEQDKFLEYFQKSYVRLNHLFDTAAIISATESRHQYRHGETYVPLLTKWIPRFLWPGKPVDALGNKWAREYGFIGQRDYVTSYNLPWLPEMFMNFGWPGVFVISLLIGWVIGEFVRGIVKKQLSPAGIAFSLAIGSSFFFPESNLSLSFGGMIISWISISALFLCLRVFTGATRSHEKSAQGGGP